MTWETTDAQGVRWRVHYDPWDGQYIWLYRLDNSDQAKWRMALTLELVRDGGA